MKRFICFVVSVIIMLSGCICTEASNITASGSCGNNSSWSIDDSGTLMIFCDEGLASTNTSHWFTHRDIIKTISINGALTYIGENAFNGLYKTETITIPDNVADISYGAFADCMALKNLVLPADLENLDLTFSDGCIALTGLYISETNKSFCSDDGILYSKNKTVLYRYPPSRNADSFTVPNSVQIISANAFRDNQNLKTITLPQGLTIDKSQFRHTITVLTDDEKEPQHITHEYIIEIHNPTCFEEGYTTYKCRYCEDEYRDHYTEKLEHIAETDKAVAPNCIKTGLTQGSHCILCGTVLVEQKVLSLTPHNFSSNICTVCGYTLPQPAVVSEKSSAASITAYNPSKAVIKKITKIKKGFKLYWKKQSKVTGYQIQYANNKSFSKGKKTITIKGKNTTSKTVKGLKSKKTYYVRLRAYYTKNGKKNYGKWSSIKKIKTK